MANLFTSTLQRLTQRAGDLGRSFGQKDAAPVADTAAPEPAPKSAQKKIGDPEVVITSPAQEYAPKTQIRLRQRAEFDRDMAPYRSIAEAAQVKPAAEAAVALNSMDKTIFDEEMAHADAPTRAKLQSYKLMVGRESDPLSEHAFKVRKTALMEKAISNPENREALMQTLAYAEISAGKENEAVSQRTQEMLEAPKDPEGIPDVLRDTVLKHAQALGIGRQFVTYTGDEDLPRIMQSLADPERQPFLSDVGRINEALVENGALLNGDMRTDVKAMRQVIEHGRMIRREEAEMASPRYTLELAK